MADTNDKRPPAAKAGKFTVKLTLNELGHDEAAPTVAIYAMTAEGTPTKKLATAKAGRLEIDPAWRKLSETVALGPDVAVKEISALKPGDLRSVRLDDVIGDWRRHGELIIPRPHWHCWFPRVACVSGSVEACHWHLHPLFAATAASGFTARLEPAIRPFPSPFPLPECHPVCDGVVEVYERRCCCRPWVILDPRLDALIDRLREIVEPRRPIPPLPDPPPFVVDPHGPVSGPAPVVPPGPGPDPAPLRTIERQFKLDAALTDPVALALPAERLVIDLGVLEGLSRIDASRYVLDRPYLHPLFCSCTTRKVGEAVIGPDGTFSFCYFKLDPCHCSTSYVYKVRQWHVNQWVYIYDGFAGHDYFAPGDDADLKSWNPAALTCGHTEPPVDGEGAPFVMLQDIGATGSHRLVSPAQTALDGIGAPLPDNGGLVDPPPLGVDPVGKLYDRPWSGTLALRLYFHPGMKALGARYYRISRVRADANGNPLGGATPVPLTAPVTWQKYVYVGGVVQVHGEGLGPTTAGAESALYKIPFDSDALWQPGQFHLGWDTLSELDGRHVLTVEVFDAAGNRLRPNGSTGAGTAKPFHFLHWNDPVNTQQVPFAQLAHVFWTDKRHCFADIEDLRKNGAPSLGECQYIEGDAGSQFSAGFRAFHANGAGPAEPFMWYYTMWYHRGLNGPNVTIETSGDNAPPTLAAGPPAESTPQTFGSMLGPHAKCAFALNLRAYAKHTDGSGRISGYDAADQAAFSLEV